MAIIISGETPTYDSETLWAIRQKVVEFSGRYDLITTDGEDAGIDFFIRAGLNFLDRSLDIDRLQARFFSKLLAGEALLALPRLRVLKAVYVIDAEGNEVRLPKVSRRDLLAANIEDSTPGFPSCYAPYSLRLAQTLTEIDPEDLASIETAEGANIEALRVYPVPDTTVDVKVYGLFYSTPLLLSGDKNFWTIRYPELLIQASLLQIEKFMRNSEGVKDQLNALLLDIQQLDFDHVDNQIVDVTRMEG